VRKASQVELHASAGTIAEETYSLDNPVSGHIRAREAVTELFGSSIARQKRCEPRYRETHKFAKSAYGSTVLDSHGCPKQI